jgi:DICT domain-containing protein
VRTALHEIIAEVERPERRLRLFDPPPGLAGELEDRLAERLVTVESLPAGAGPDGYAVLVGDGVVLASADVRGLAPPFADVDDALARLYDELDPLSFSSSDHGVLSATTREIEDRAWRAGTGTLHVGLRRPAVLRARSDVYSRLGRSDLDVRAYVDAASDVPRVENVAIRAVDCDDIRRTDFVAFDGGPARENGCALLVSHRDDTRTGVWTYDPDAVDRLVGHLARQYPLAR